jgi:hypothetical protein
VRVAKPWVALAAVALSATMARPARADPSLSVPPEDPPAKRPVPDYGGRRPEPKTARDVLLWVPRLVLSPLYLVSEYLIRAPLSAAIPALERAEAPRKLYDFLAFGSEHKAGIVPVGYADFGFNPSVGVFGFWNDAFAKGNDWSVHTEAWPDDWYAFALKESARLDSQRVLHVQVSGVHRPDRVFYGIGPESLQSSQSRFTEAVADESAMLDWKYWRESRLQLTAGLHSESLGPGHHGHDPSLQQEAATGAFPVPYGFGGRYTDEYNRALLSIDSRQPVPATGSGARVELKAEQGSNMLASPASGWIRYGATAAGFLDLDQHRHVVSLSVATQFVDPLGDSPIPFTELVSLGGDGPMRGYFPRRMLGRSAAAAALHYVWPIAPWLGGNIEAALGNVFDEHLEGFRPELLRFSGDVGISTIGVSDYPIEVVVGIGSETFEHGGQIDSLRIQLSANHGF